MKKRDPELILRIFLRKILKILLSKKILKTPAKADVFLLSNRKLVGLKKKFMGKEAKIVDVLSFPELPDFPSAPTEKKTLGEIFINKEIARKTKDGAICLLIHGALHLSGFRHEGKRDTIKMEKLEKMVRNKLNINCPNG